MGISVDRIHELIGNRDQVVIFEVGCADGTDTRQFLSKFGTNLKIYTFDPDPTNIKAMSEVGGVDVKGNSNSKLRSDGRHTFTSVAIAAQDGKTTFTRSRNVNGPGGGTDWRRYSGSIYEPKTIINSPKYGNRWPMIQYDEKIEVTTRSIDSFCDENGIKHIDFMWMDVQGAEKEVFRGAKNMIGKIDYIYTEYHEEEMYEGATNLQTVTDLLVGYDMEQNWPYNDVEGGDALFKLRG